MHAILECIVENCDNEKTVEKILKKKFDISSSLMTFLKLNARLRRNNIVCRSVDVCKVGDILTADVSENIECCNIKPNPNIDLEILFEDDFILVVNKPGNITSHPSMGNRENSLANAVMYHWIKNGEYHNYHILNRLDKGTSGICIIAKNRFAHGVLSKQMREGIIEKKYTAIVHGTFENETGSIEFPIRRVDESVIKRMVAVDGKYAKTNYKAKRISDKVSLVDISLETGRTHQIRVHFSHIGHPLFGDWLYGAGDEEKALIDRQALHSGYIKFLHPEDKKEMVFNQKMPSDMEYLLAICEKGMEK